jgi:hypothetical protein
MALPTLDAVFASAADQPRRYMLSQWLIEELGSGSIADYVTLPERYLWAKIAVAAGAPKTEADYISLPKQYAWKDIYDAVSGSSLGTIDWSEKQALGHIAAAYRGDTANPANLATYIDWPWRYQVASIITQLATTTTFNAVIVSGAGSFLVNGTYEITDESNGKPYYVQSGGAIFSIYWDDSLSRWVIAEGSDEYYESYEDVATPDLVVTWSIATGGWGQYPVPTVTPTNV